MSDRAYTIAFDYGLEDILTEEGQWWFVALGVERRMQIEKWLSRLPDELKPRGAKTVRGMQAEIARLRKVIDRLVQKEKSA